MEAIGEKAYDVKMAGSSAMELSLTQWAAITSTNVAVNPLSYPELELPVHSRWAQELVFRVSFALYRLGMVVSSSVLEHLHS